MTEIEHECHRDDYTVCIPPFLSLNTVWCSAVLVMRTHVTMRGHADDSQDVVNIGDERCHALPMTENS